MTFAESAVFVQVLLLALLLLLFVLQLYLQNLCRNYREKKALFLNLIPMAATVLLTLLLTWDRNSAAVLPFSMPLAAAVGLTAALIAVTVAEVARQRRVHRDVLSADSVREACERIPVGLCFFSPGELPVLCNGQMTRVTRELIGKNMQSLGELERALENPAEGVAVLLTGGRRNYRLSDGREWYFEKTEISDRGGNRYFQYTAADRTELNALNAELEARNAELKKMMRRLEHIRANISDSIREQEILTAKMRLHNKMGSCMLGARRYLLQGCPEAGKGELLERWQKTVGDLRDEIGQTDESAPGEELTRLAKSSGVEVVLHGTFPDDPDVAYLFVAALRECLTNAIRHAGATRLDLTLTDNGDTVTGVYTNDGAPPERNITEGGGLRSLRSRIEKEGGSVTVHSVPAFSLTVTLPKKLRDEEEREDD